MQSTYCDNIRQHCENIGRTVHIVNLGGLLYVKSKQCVPELFLCAAAFCKLKAPIRNELAACHFATT